ncbi:sensor domain-containing phosphodiesterase [Balneatrix alpica]|uniref:sensor domain-containing phosphodiesterase n=1 Tax=Balneatrix alpica TaxID=75684 RepID=UPI0027391010|nr:EAL domain-containing protein [Balneatrix alpica]
MSRGQLQDVRSSLQGRYRRHLLSVILPFSLLLLGLAALLLFLLHTHQQDLRQIERIHEQALFESYHQGFVANQEAGLKSQVRISESQQKLLGRIDHAWIDTVLWPNLQSMGSHGLMLMSAQGQPRFSRLPPALVTHAESVEARLRQEFWYVFPRLQAALESRVAAIWSYSRVLLLAEQPFLLVVAPVLPTSAIEAPEGALLFSFIDLKQAYLSDIRERVGLNSAVLGKASADWGSESLQLLLPGQPVGQGVMISWRFGSHGQEIFTQLIDQISYVLLVVVPLVFFLLYRLWQLVRRLYREIQQRKFHAQWLQLRHQSTAELSQNQELDLAMASIARQLQVLLPGALVLVELLDSAGAKLLSPICSEALPGIDSYPQIGEAGQRIPTERALYFKRPELIQDLQLEPDAKTQRWAKQHGWQCLWVFPLLGSGDTPQGCLSILFASSQQPQANEFEHLVALAQVLGLGVERIRTQQRLAQERINLEEAQSLARVGSWEYDYAQGRLLCSDHWLKLMCPEQLPAHLSDLLLRVLPQDRQRIEQLHASEQSFETEYRIKVRQQVLVVHERVNVEQDQDGLLVRKRGIVQDVTEKRSQDRQQKLLAWVVEHASDGIMIADKNLKIIYVNQAFTAITGYSSDEVLGESPRVLSSHQHDAEFYARMWRDLFSDGLWQGEIYNRRKSGEVYPEWLTISAIKDSYGHITHFAGVFADISTRKAQEQALAYQAQHDMLTGLLNRTGFQEVLQQGGEYRALALLDLDGFKQVNDSYGHPLGDAVLQQVAQRMQQLLPKDLPMARLGGDEFVLLLQANYEAQLNALLALLSEAYWIEEHELRVTASAGVSLIPEHGRDFEVLFKRADIALLHVKQQGRQHWSAYSEELMQVRQRRIELERDLKHALAADELSLVYQPQLSIQTGQWVGVEALLRWRHPERGWVSPAEFIPLAEETGMIHPLSEWVLLQVFSQVRQWQQGPMAGVPVAVNISGMQLRRPQALSSLLQRLLRQTGLPASLFKLEVTEGSLIQNVEETSRVLQDLREFGFAISVDDFGTGYSSLSYLHRFPLDQLKVDKSFIDLLLVSEAGETLVRTILTLGHNLGMAVIAEGVEEQAQAERLLSLGCGQIQGYWFAKPLAAEELLALAQRHQVAAWRLPGAPSEEGV